MVGSLPKCFDKKYFDVRVILPKYMCMKEEFKSKLEYITHFYMDLGWRSQYVGVLGMNYDGIQYYFIDNEIYFAGPKPYGNIYEDTGDRSDICMGATDIDTFNGNRIIFYI